MLGGPRNKGDECTALLAGIKCAKDCISNTKGPGCSGLLGANNRRCTQCGNIAKACPPSQVVDLFLPGKYCSHCFCRGSGCSVALFLYIPRVEKLSNGMALLAILFQVAGCGRKGRRRTTRWTILSVGITICCLKLGPSNDKRAPVALLTSDCKLRTSNRATRYGDEELAGLGSSLRLLHQSQCLDSATCNAPGEQLHSPMRLTLLARGKDF